MQCSLMMAAKNTWAAGRRFIRSGVVIAVAVSLGALNFGPVRAAGPISPFQIGAWKVGAYTNDQTGAFSQCSAMVTYKSNITMFVVVTRGMAWSLAFSHPQWSLSKGESVALQLRFDGGSPYDQTGVTLLASPALVEVPMPDNSQLINSFRLATQMTAFARGQSYTFRLDGTSQLLPALVNCVRTALLAENNKPVGSNSPPANPPAEGTAIEEMQLATNFLLATQLHNAHLISRADAPAVFATLGATWKTDDAVGAVKIYPAKSGQSGLEFASDLIASDARTCQGKFASARSSDLVDSDVVFRAGTSCSDTQGERQLQYYITPWHKSNFAVFAVMSTHQVAEGQINAETQANTFRKAVLGATR
jgi:hypothetical protein